MAPYCESQKRRTYCIKVDLEIPASYASADDFHCGSRVDEWIISPVQCTIIMLKVNNGKLKQFANYIPAKVQLFNNKCTKQSNLQL